MKHWHYFIGRLGKNDDDFKRHIHMAHGLISRYKIPDHSTPLVIQKINGDIRKDRHYVLHPTIYLLTNPWTGMVAVGIQDNKPVTVLGMYMRYSEDDSRGKIIHKLYKTALSRTDLPDTMRERLENYNEVTLNALNDTTTSPHFDVLWEQGIYKAHSRPYYTTEQDV